MQCEENRIAENIIYSFIVGGAVAVMVFTAFYAREFAYIIAHE